MSVAKSYKRENDPIAKYCVKHTHIHPVQEALQEATMHVRMSRMLGAPECLALNKTLIKAKAAKKVIDIGTFTGASALAAALAFEKDDPDCKVITCDVDDSHLELARKHWKLAEVDDKIQFELGPAADTLQKLIDAGESETFDFVFIDADKTGYDVYYEKCLILLKKGGVIAIDNTLWSGAVITENGSNDDENTAALKKLNDKLANDKERVFSTLINVGDGYTLATKL